MKGKGWWLIHQVPLVCCEEQRKVGCSLGLLSREKDYSSSPIYWHAVSWFLQDTLKYFIGFLRTKWKSVDWGPCQFGGSTICLNFFLNTLSHSNSKARYKQMEKGLMSSWRRPPVLYSLNQSYLPLFLYLKLWIKTQETIL